MRNGYPQVNDEPPTVMVVKVAEGYEVRVTTDGKPRRVVEDRNLWLLPGSTCYSNDNTIFQQVWTDVFAHLGIAISRFDQMIQRDIVPVEDRQGGEPRKVLVLTFSAHWRQVSPPTLPNPKFETGYWVQEDSLRDQSFPVRNYQLRHVLKSYLRGKIIFKLRYWRI